jgi:hypothetical protein
MSLWGKSDSLFNTGNISVNLTTKVATVSSGTLPAAATIEGAVVTITGKGSAVIKERLSNTTFSVVNTTGLDGSAISAVAYNISEQPVYLNEDSNYDGEEIFGVDTSEQAAANGGSGFARQLAPPHAGWVGISTYVDMHGTLRVKTETIVAGSSITGDASDDAKYTP